MTTSEMAKQLVHIVQDDEPSTKSTYPWHAPHLLKLNYCTISLVLFGKSPSSGASLRRLCTEKKLASANGYDSSMVNSLQSISRWMEFMDEPTGAWLGFISISYWIGLLLTYLVAPSISNRYGRKLGLYIGILFIIAGAILQGLAPNPGAWIVGRAFAGCAASLWSCNAPALITEVAYPSHRAVVSSFYQCGYYIGSSLAAWIIYGTLGFDNSWSWRIPSFLQLILPVIAVPGLLLCPESPRWLMSQSRNEEATALFTKWHAAGDQDSHVVSVQITEIQEALEQEKRIGAGSSYLDMLKTRGNRRRFWITVSLALFSQWGGNGVVSFYLTMVLDTIGITKASDQLIITASMQIWNLLCGIIAASFVTRLGKRPLFHASAAVMFVSYASITGLSGAFAADNNASVGIAVVPFLFIFFAGYGMAL